MSEELTTQDREALEVIQKHVSDQPGRMKKVLFFDERGAPQGDAPSTQLPENPFTNRMDRVGLQYPPYPLEMLILLAEQHPIHASCLEQKTVDTVGQGWEWVADADEEGGDAAPDPAVRAQLDDWLNSLAAGEQTMHEVLMMAWDDYLTTGQGYLEVVRDATGAVVQLYHVPSHTCRFHHDGYRIAQLRGSKMVWFKRWGAPPIDGQEVEVDRQYSSIKPVGQIPENRVANELFVFQKPSRRSSWYGIPSYVSAIGWISLALSCRDDNLMFFENRREPRWAVVLTNLEDDPNLEDDLRQAFAVDLKRPHRNLIIPLVGNGKIDFQQLSSDTRDGSYGNLDDRADMKILVSHRVPPERLGLTKVGSLGGDVSIDSTRVYKEAVIEPEQAMLSARMNRFIEIEFPGDSGQAPPKDAAVANSKGWKWKPVEIDLAEEAQDQEQAYAAFKSGLVTVDQAREMAGWDPLDVDVYGDPEDGGTGGKFYFELFGPGVSAANPYDPATATAPPAPPPAMPGDPSAFGKMQRQSALSLARVDQAIAELLGHGDRT